MFDFSTLYTNIQTKYPILQSESDDGIVDQLLFQWWWKKKKKLGLLDRVLCGLILKKNIDFPLIRHL